MYPGGHPAATLSCRWRSNTTAFIRSYSRCACFCEARLKKSGVSLVDVDPCGFCASSSRGAELSGGLAALLFCPVEPSFVDVDDCWCSEDLSLRCSSLSKKTLDFEGVVIVMLCFFVFVWSGVVWGMGRGRWEVDMGESPYMSEVHNVIHSPVRSIGCDHERVEFFVSISLICQFLSRHLFSL